MEKEAPLTNKFPGSSIRRNFLIQHGIYTPAYDWANHKKNIGEGIAIHKRTHKQFLRKNHLGKFAKH